MRAVPNRYDRAGESIASDPLNVASTSPKGCVRMDRRPAPSIPPDMLIRRRIPVLRGVSFDVATEADPRDPISRELAMGVYPPLCRPSFELAGALVPESGRVLDLGAHIGTFALAASASGHRVLAVEAAPRNVELLDASRRENRFDRLRVVHAAVSDHRGEVGFIPAGPFGYVVAESSPVGGLNVPAVPVDELLDEVGWDRVDFIKMDVEGSEVSALIGMSRLLQRHDAPTLLVESNGHTLHFFGETPTSLKAALAAYGYRIFQVDRRRLIPVTIEELQATTVVDYLAVKRLPCPPRRWRFDVPMSARERLRRIRASFRSEIEPDRLYIARALADSPDALRIGRDIAPGPRPWYALGRR